MKLNCSYFDNNSCRSCEGLEIGPVLWREQMRGQLESNLVGPWLEPFWSPKIFGSRTKAKFVVAQTSENPILGRVNHDGEVLELSGCQLHHHSIRDRLDLIKNWITKYNLTPYDIKARKGELKYVILQLIKNDQLMLRFVMRSKESLDRLQKLVASEKWQDHFGLISVNLQPEAKAVLEGDVEIVLTGEEFLPVKIGEVELYLGTKSFVQTNLEVASALYLEAKEWLKNSKGRVLDLFCGVGGFALHLSHPLRQVVGVELSKEAIMAAKKVDSDVEFVAGDAWDYLKKVDAFDVIVVNPPRRGLGSDICQRLNELAPSQILYSSCNPETLKSDLEMLNYKVEKLKAFEMFPMTKHWEVLCLLSRL